MLERRGAHGLGWAVIASIVASGGAAADPHLSMPDAFAPFVPGLLDYQRERGTQSPGVYRIDFGVTTTSIDLTSMSIFPFNDLPDLKRRVRVTIDEGDPNQNPSGDIVIEGLVYEADPDDPTAPATESVPPPAVLHFITNGTKTTTTYFDKVTRISTPGLSMAVNITVDWWDGHEQEMNVGVGIDEVDDQTSCENDWLVYFNGQVALPAWDPVALSCGAGLLGSGAERGLYFPVVVDDDAEDAYHNFDPVLGHVDDRETWSEWLASSGQAASYFDVTDERPDVRLRPIVVQLERQSDLQIVDAARLLLTITVDPWGQPSLLWMTNEAQVSPGAIAMLTPRGLNRLEPTHKATLTYPIVAGGKQPRLSESAIELDPHSGGDTTVNLADLDADSLDYWTNKHTPDFAGHAAYESIKLEALGMAKVFDKALKVCQAMPNLLARLSCEAALRASSCVEHTPTEKDFRIHVLGIDTYFDPARTDDALGIGDIAAVDLQFGTNEVLADFALEDVLGWLEASIDPADIQIEWDKPAADPCTIKPAARTLANFESGADPDGWLECSALSFAAAGGALDEPIAFDIVAHGEDIDVLFPLVGPDVTLSDVTVDPGVGICADAWLRDVVEAELLTWQYDVERELAEELHTSPGEDEALKRLLSPYELGVEEVTNPPPDTPPYVVHPLDTFALNAQIGRSNVPGDPAAHADADDGLYVPYLTTSIAEDNTPFVAWLCPVGPRQACVGKLDPHSLPFVDGRDPAGTHFDVGMALTTAYLSHSLWAQARREDRLGAPLAPARLSLTDTAVVDLAEGLQLDRVVDALTATGATALGIRYHEAAAPFMLTTDVPPRIVFAAPQIVVDLVAVGPRGAETVLATFLVDVIDRDLQVQLATGGAPGLEVHWGELSTPMLTTTFLPECYDEREERFWDLSCDTELHVVVAALLWPALDDALLAMVEAMPAPTLFDAGQESSNPRQLTMTRSFVLDSAVGLAADLCKPGTTGC